MNLTDQLIEAATNARANAVAPSSHFHVGAAVRTAGGKIFTGCNIENATLGLTLCAERVALFKAMSEGERQFTHVAIVADTAGACYPCGACRQILAEFAPDAMILCANLRGHRVECAITSLLPHPFDVTDIPARRP